jgi:ABC-2 type transport system permease protein
VKNARLTALWRRELLDLRRNSGALLPVVIVGLMALVLPFAVTIAVPGIAGQRLGDESDLVAVSGIMGAHPELTTDGRVQLFLFQQFLLVFLLIPITGAMSLAAHAIVGEKQARTLEPLLATPVSTYELLVAKIAGSLVPTLVIAAVLLVLYFVGIGALAEPGVLRALANGRSAVLIAGIGPAAALVALQAALVISSRVNDARTAQQFSVLLILPLTGLLIAQFAGWTWLSGRALLLIVAGLLVMWVILLIVSVVLFDRETILTRWR